MIGGKAKADASRTVIDHRSARYHFCQTPLRTRTYMLPSVPNWLLVEYDFTLTLLQSCKGLVPCAPQTHAALLLSFTILYSLSRSPCTSPEMSAPLPLDESRGPSLIISNWTTVSIASFLVILRIYARAFLRKLAGADDWTIVIALVNLIHRIPIYRHTWKTISKTANVYSSTYLGLRHRPRHPHQFPSRRRLRPTRRIHSPHPNPNSPPLNDHH